MSWPIPTVVRVERRIKRLQQRVSTIREKIIPKLSPSRANFAFKLSYYRSQASAIAWALRYIEHLESENGQQAVLVKELVEALQRYTSNDHAHGGCDELTSEAEALLARAERKGGGL